MQRHRLLTMQLFIALEFSLHAAQRALERVNCRSFVCYDLRRVVKV